ncbi:MAG: protein kinase [Pyrinomonadaceae bacterium]
MNPERWKQIDDLLDAVLDIPNERRAEFLSEKCNGDDDLKREVLSLLGAQKESDRFLENSAMNLMAKEIASDRTEVLSYVGREFGTYKIEKAIGAGGMGEVYLAHDEKLKRKVALKILPAEFIADAERIRRFEREARMISALNHPYIVTIHDVGSADGINYIATEFVEGETVRELINRGAGVKQTLSIVSQTCEALEAAHKAGIIHRDIKPENIMLRPDGFVKVLDFGLAKLNEHAEIHQSLTNYTMKGVIIGTPVYMSPQQVSDEKVDHRTDLWSVGVVLYEMLTGKNPFKGDSRQATFQKILSEQPPLVSQLDGKLPIELDAILSKALEKDTDVSYQTALDLRADLKRVRREIDSSPSLRSGSLTQRRESPNPKSKFLYIPITAVLLILIGAGAWFLVSRNRKAVYDADWGRATNIQLTEQAGTEFFPSLAPDGKSFIYTRESGGGLDLFWQRIGGKNPTNLTKEFPGDDTEPAFSPDGELIAFRSDREPTGIYVMGATGENARRVGDFGHHPSWSPDGKEIAVSTAGRDLPNLRNATPSSIWIINIESGAKRMLIESDGTQPAWSPDGKKIAYWFMQPQGGKRDVAVISASGGEPVIVSKDGVINWNPVWSPDGKFLYFVSDRGGNMNFWRVAVDDASGAPLGEPEAVVSPSKYSRHLGFSSDGTRMIYVQTDNKSNIQAINFDVKSRKTIGDLFWITAGDRLISRAELSPDGQQFVVRLVRRTQDDIVLINRKTGEISDLTEDEAFDRYPRWSPDGRKIAFISDRGGSHEIWTIDAAGTNPKQVTFTNSKGATFPHWSPDGTRMLFRLDQQNFIIDLNKSWDEQTPTVLPDPPNNAKFTVWDWSPDGKTMVGSFSGGWQGIGTYSLDSPRYEKISDLEEIPMWLPDSRHITFSRNGKVYILDTVTKKIEEIPVASSGVIRSASVSRDGSLLYFTTVSNESDIWLLDISPGSQ